MVPNYCKGILLNVVLLTWLQHTSVFVSCQPHDSVAVVNQSAIFNCSTVVPKIVWYHYAVGSDETQGGEVVYRAGNVFNKYKTDFHVDEYEITGTYFCNLIIKTVKENFAGKYECRDKDGVGSVQSAQLIVIDSDATCRPDSNPVSVIGLNDCSREAEQVELSCSVNFSGNKPPIGPILKWTSDVSQTQDGLKFTHGIVNGQVTSNVTLNSGNYVSDKKFVCRATQSIGNEELCAFDIRVLYAMNTTMRIDKVVGDEVNCSVNTSSHSCHYEWIKHDEEKLSPVSSISVLKIENSGLHQCHATCVLLDKKCLIFGTTVNASKSAIDKNSTEGLSGAAIAVIVVLVLVILISIPMIVYICGRRNRRGFGKKIPTNVQYEGTSKALISNSGDELQPISFQPDSAQAESATGHPKLVENTGFGKNNPTSVQNEDTSKTLISDSGAGLQPMSFQLASTQPEFAAGRPKLEEHIGEGKNLKRKRSEDEIFDKSVDPGAEPGNSGNSSNSTLESGNHNKTLFENVTPKFLCTLTAQVENNCEKAIAGVAVCKEKLFVVFEGSSTVEVFHAITFAFEDSFVISNLNKPLDIASCPAEDCFFIYASGNDSSGEILVMNRSGSILLSWQTYEAEGRLSVTLDSRVILSVWSSCLLKVYSADGLHLKDVKLPSNIQPFHALNVAEDEFLISCEEKNQKIHGIWLVNSNGELVRNITEQVAFPRYLSLTSDGECLIADSRNSQILLLTRMFEIVDILSVKDGLSRPVRIYFDYSNGQRLFVADNGDRNPRVMIYEFPSND